MIVNLCVSPALLPAAPPARDPAGIRSLTRASPPGPGTPGPSVPHGPSAEPPVRAVPPQTGAVSEPPASRDGLPTRTVPGARPADEAQPLPSPELAIPVPVPVPVRACPGAPAPPTT